MKNLVRQRSSKGLWWAPGAATAAAAILAVMLIAIKRYAADAAPTSHEDNHGRDNSSSNRDSQPPSDSDDHTSGGGGAGVDEPSATRDSRDDNGEGIGEGANDEEDYVVLTEAQIGPAIQRACSSPDFVECSREVRRTWNLLGAADQVEAMCARVYDAFKTRDPEVASLFRGGLSATGQERKVEFAISKIVEGSTDPARLEGILRHLGETSLTNGAKEPSEFQPLCEALVQAAGDALDNQEHLLDAYTVGTWSDFLLTVSACLWLAGTGVRARQRRRYRDQPGLSSVGAPGYRGDVSAVHPDWEWDGKGLVYRLPRPEQEVSSTMTEKRRILEGSVNAITTSACESRATEAQ